MSILQYHRQGIPRACRQLANLPVQECLAAPQTRKQGANSDLSTQVASRFPSEDILSPFRQE